MPSKRRYASSDDGDPAPDAVELLTSLLSQGPSRAAVETVLRLGVAVHCAAKALGLHVPVDKDAQAEITPLIEEALATQSRATSSSSASSSRSSRAKRTAKAARSASPTSSSSSSSPTPSPPASPAASVGPTVVLGAPEEVVTPAAPSPPPVEGVVPGASHGEAPTGSGSAAAPAASTVAATPAASPLPASYAAVVATGATSKPAPQQTASAQVTAKPVPQPAATVQPAPTPAPKPASKPASPPAAPTQPPTQPATKPASQPPKTVYGTAYPKHSRGAPDRHVVVLPCARITLEIIPGTLRLFDAGGSVSVRDTADPKWRGTLRSLGVRDVKGVRHFRYSLTSAGHKQRAELLLDRGVIAMLRSADGKPRPAAQLLY